MISGLPHPLLTIVPMKPLAEAKTRLWDDLPPPERQAVVLLMLERVVAAAVSATARGACVVVGGDEIVREVAEASGARWGPDTADGLNAALWSAMQTAYADGAKAALFLPGDLPLILDDDVRALDQPRATATPPRSASARRATAARTRCCNPPARRSSRCFGEQQLREALSKPPAASGAVTLVTPDLPHIAFDLDTRADYEWARQNVASFAQSVYDWEDWLNRSDR